MFDLQTIIRNAIDADRARELEDSPQLLLGELIRSLENVDRSLPIFFSSGERPTGLCSWRGSYKELAICDVGDSDYFEAMKENCERDEFGDHRYDCKCGTPSHSTKLSEKVTAGELLDMLNNVVGKYFIGWKGGDFTMSRRTPVWNDNPGDGGRTMITDIKSTANMVIIQTMQETNT